MKKIKGVCKVLLLLMMLAVSNVHILAEENMDEEDHRYVIVSQVRNEATNEIDTTYRCEICNQEYVIHTPFVANQMSDWIVDVSATCTTDGHAYRKNLDTNEIIETREIPAVGHNYVLVDEIAPTESELGRRIYRCTNGGETYVETFGELVKPTIAHEHTFEKKIIKEATCETTGLIEYTCKEDGYSYTEVIPKLKHKYGDWQIVKAAKAGETGLAVRTCEVCGTTEEKIIAALAKQRLFNEADIAIQSINVGLIVGFGLVFSSYWKMMKWNKKIRKEVIENNLQQKEKIKLYEFY